MENNLNEKKQRNVLAIGRWMPVHNGHKDFLINLAKEFDLLVIAIGSSNENGTSRNCIPAVEREKILRCIFKNENIDENKVKIVQLPDRNLFETWADDVVELCNLYNITHLCTGNREDILDILDEKNIVLNVEFINPEENTKFHFHATDIRNAIIDGNMEKLGKMVPIETMDLIEKFISKEIIKTNIGKGKKYIEGIYTADLLIFVEDANFNKKYLLLNKESNNNEIFSVKDEVGKFETSIETICRKFYDENGLKMKVLDNSCEPAVVQIENISSTQKLNYIGIFTFDENTENARNANYFYIVLNGDLRNIENIVKSKNMELKDINNIENLEKFVDFRK